MSGISPTRSELLRPTDRKVTGFTDQLSQPIPNFGCFHLWFGNEFGARFKHQSVLLPVQHGATSAFINETEP